MTNWTEYHNPAEAMLIAGFSKAGHKVKPAFGCVGVGFGLRYNTPGFFAKAAPGQMLHRPARESKRWIFLFILLWRLGLPAWLGASIYYLDATNGNDAHTGRHPDSAWQNLSAISLSSPMPGDTFLLKRGEIWDSTRWYIQFSGTAQAPVVLGAYGDAAAALPIISSIGQLPGLDNAVEWTEESPGVWAATLSASPGRLFLDDAEALRSGTLAELGVVDNAGAVGTWFWNEDDQSLFIAADENPAMKYSSITGSLHFITVQVALSSHLVFQDLDMRGGTGAAFSARGSTNIEVRQCSLGRYGNSGVRLLDILLEGVRHPTTYITISGNTLDSGFSFFYSGGSERGCGDGMRIICGVHDCVVSGNTFVNWAHNAIELSANVEGAAGVFNNQFYDNHITAPDIPYAHPLGMDGLLGKCHDNEFYRNFIDSCRTTSQVNGNNNRVHHNIVIGLRNSPNKVVGTAYAFAMGIYGNGLVSQDNRFDHNLIIDADEAAFQIRSFGFPGTVKGHLIRNNVIYETGQSPDDDRYAVGTGIEIYNPGDTGVGPNTYQNNLFYNSLSDSNFVFIREIDTHYSAAEFNALNGLNGNTISGNVYGDPSFTSLGSGNFVPQPGAPAIDAGLDLGYAVDYAEMARTEGMAPDIGPFETNHPAPCTPVDGDSVVIAPMALEPADALVEGNYASYDTLDVTGGTVYAGATVSMLAEEQLIFRAGFSVEAGAYFNARISTLCGPAALMQAGRLSPEGHSPVLRAAGFTLRVAPNPASNLLQVRYSIEEGGPVSLTLINLQGQMAGQVLQNAHREAGRYRLNISLDDHQSGMYILLLQHNGRLKTERVVVQKH